MKITTDNTIVDNNVNTYKCPVTGDGTVLLMPSQVKKYLGSFMKHKLINLGILLPKDYLVDIVSEETINDNKWLLVSYNNKYYYTPKEYIDCSKVIDLNINKLEDNFTENRLNSMPSKLGMSRGNTTENYNNEITYDVSNCQIGEALKDIELRDMPDPKSNVVTTIHKGDKCIIQSIWNNDEYKSKWFRTGSYSPYNTLYGKYINNNNIKLTSSAYYSIMISDIDCKYMSNSTTYAKLKRGDLTYPKYQDWGKGLHVNVGLDYNANNAWITYTYPASKAAPLADSPDMFNKELLGELKVERTATIYLLHRKSNYKAGSDERKNSLDNISLASLKTLAATNSVVKNIMEHGFKDPKKGPGLKYKNADFLSPSEIMVVTNYTMINGKNYYIGFKKGSSKDGSVYYIALLDGGKDYINYVQYNPKASSSTNIPIDGSVNTNYSFIGPTDVKVDVNSYNKDTSNLDDLTRIEKIHDNNENTVVGVHLGIGNTSGYKVPGILQNAPETPPEYDGWSILSSVQNYNLSNEKPFDTKHLTHINRFHLPTGNSGLGTKSFIFMTRPDLNLYTESDDGSINTWEMNPDLKHLPGFKYIARLRGTPEAPGIGTTIMDSLEYFGTNAINTPWLTVFSNQANGYSVVDRELDVVEMGETFHGNKVIYAEPTFKHKIGGQVQIPFTERRDLTLYYTLRMWIEYIQAVSMGFCSPRMEHKRNAELDYAVSLFYITTDETMENILYWEKLTGVIPLTVPDSFFEWSEGNGAREMKYNISFAYSFRTVMDELHLAEINNLYEKRKKGDTNATAMPIVPKNNYDYIFDNKNNDMLVRLAAFYEDITDDNAAMSELINNKKSLEKYYYGGIINSNGSIVDSYTVKGSDSGLTKAGDVANAKFLPNYNMYTRMYGIPYVKGPFIEHDPDSQKYKLRWV